MEVNVLYRASTSIANTAFMLEKLSKETAVKATVLLLVD